MAMTVATAPVVRNNLEILASVTYFARKMSCEGACALAFPSLQTRKDNFCIVRLNNFIKPINL